MTRRNNFTKATQREAFARSEAICGCHRLARAGVPGFSSEGCGVQLGIGNTFYEHVNPDALSKDNSLANCATLTKTCWDMKTRPRQPRLIEMLWRGKGYEPTVKAD